MKPAFNRQGATKPKNKGGCLLDTHGKEVWGSDQNVLIATPTLAVMLPMPFIVPQRQQRGSGGLPQKNFHHKILYNPLCKHH